MGDEIKVLFEQLRSDIKGVADGHSVIRQEIQQAKDELGSRIDIVESVVRSHSRQFVEIRSELNKIQETVSDIQRDLKTHINQPVHLAHAAV